MIKKLLLIFLLLLCSCNKAEFKDDEYIDPAKDVFIFSCLSQELQERIKDANKGREYDNYQFEMFFKDGFAKALTDINGNDIDLNKLNNYVLDISSIHCSHCAKQLSFINELSDKYDLPIIQYFNDGNKDEIFEFYEDNETTMSENIIVVESNDELKDYVREYIGIEFYPTLLFYRNNKVSFCFVGEFDEDIYLKLNDIAYENYVNEDDLKDETGNSYLTVNRSLDDVKNSLSKENQDKIAYLDNDDYTEELTYSLMGNTFDFETISNHGAASYVKEIDDFTVYKDKPLSIIYTTLENGEEDIAFINELINDSDISYVVVQIESANSLKYRNLNTKLRCPLVSHLAAIPDDFYRFGIIAYPSAVFVNNGTFTGAYSNIKDKEMFAYAEEIFLKENSIAYKKNN